MKKALVMGAGGFIGSHLVRRLVDEDYWVRGVDLKYPEFWETAAHDFVIGDLRDPNVVSKVMFSPDQKTVKGDIHGFDEVYQLAADMGGAGYVFTGDSDADIMHNSALINLNVADIAAKSQGSVKKIFYSSSACMYPEENQLDPDNPNCAEDSAYPAHPDSEYGWEKLFSERMYLAFKRNYNLDVKIARFHNIFGPYGTWDGGREKAPAALCRKIAKLKNGGGIIDVWGDGSQTRSFLYVDECVEGVIRLMRNTEFDGPVNIGSDEMISIRDLVYMIGDISGKDVSINYIDGPTGVRGRNSDNRLIKEKLDWAPREPLRKGMEKTYDWIKKQVDKKELVEA